MARKKKDQTGRLGLRTGNPDYGNQKLMAAALQRWNEREEKLKAVCESPIEIGLARTVAALWVEVVDGPLTILKGEQPTMTPAEGLSIIGQVPVGKYRVDFIFIMHVPGQHKAVIVVECDGHDFHERTKAQAAHDKSRDREIALIGLKVLRFTGSEIHNNPLDCAEEVLQHLGLKHVSEWGEDGST